MRTHPIASRSAIVVAFAFALAAALLPSRARADNELSARVSTSFPGGGSGLYAAGDSSVLTEGELGYARSVGYVGRSRLWAEGDYMVASRSGAFFGGFNGSLLLQRATAGVRWSVPVKPWLVPHLRLGFGLAAGDYTLKDANSTRTNDWAAAFTAHALVGVELLLPRAWMKESHKTGFTAGLVVEGGFTYATPLAFTLAPAHSGDTITTPQSGANVGSVDLMGAVVRVGAVVWF